MNKTEFISNIAEKSGLSKKDSEKMTKAFIDTVSEALKNRDKVQIIGFGTFETSERAARTGRNPKTGESVEVPASFVPKFKFSKSFKDIIKGK